MALELSSLSLTKLRDGLLAKTFSVAEVVLAYLAEIEKKNKNINAYLEVFSDAEEEAKNLDALVSKGEKPDLLFGLPLAVKDNILIEGKRAGAASKMLDNYIAPYDAGVVTLLKEKKVIFLGRTNMDEFAMGGSTENSAYGVTKNPHDERRVAGGSSGGSAAAVAANLALASLGSDTGGSIREPASFCGVVGLKPTYGTVSRSGLMAMASSLDQIGPFAKTVEDAEILFSAISGKDPRDGTSHTIRKEDGKKVSTIGVPMHLLKEGIDADVLTSFKKTLEGLTEKGFEVVDISLPALSYALAAYYIIMPAEVSSNMARFDGLRYGHFSKGENVLESYALSRGGGFGPEVRRRIMLGTYVLSAGYYDAYYGKAVGARRLIKEEFNKAFTRVDAIVLPVSPTPAFLVGERVKDPLSMYVADIFTVSANLAGIPAISVPAGTVSRDGKDLPIGFQIMAPGCCEDRLFNVGRIIESLY